MKIKFKKFIYLANDITNIILKKDIEDKDSIISKYKTIIIILTILLIATILLNIILWK